MTTVSERAARAVELFNRHYNCAQSVFTGCAVTEQLDDAERLSLAAPFGGGVAHMGEICGALTGALMALGEASQVGCEADPVTRRNELYQQSQRVMERFRTSFGSIRCAELTGCMMATEEGAHRFRERGLRNSLCMGIVAAAADLVDQEVKGEDGVQPLDQLN